MFLDHTRRGTTVGRTPLDEWSARRRDLYLTTHDAHNRQISMPPVGFEPTISAGERPQAEPKNHSIKFNFIVLKLCQFLRICIGYPDWSSLIFYIPIVLIRRSQWPRGLRRRSAAAPLLRSWIRIPPGAWMFVCCECRVLSGRGLCDELITRPEESYQLWCAVCDLETSRINAPYIYDISSLRVNDLTLILLMWRKRWTPNNASKWQMGFNSAFKGLMMGICSEKCVVRFHRCVNVIECTYTNLDIIAYYTPILYIAYCS